MKLSPLFSSPPLTNSPEAWNLCTFSPADAANLAYAGATELSCLSTHKHKRHTVLTAVFCFGSPSKLFAEVQSQQNRERCLFRRSSVLLPHTIFFHRRLSRSSAYIISTTRAHIATTSTPPRLTSSSCAVSSFDRVNSTTSSNMQAHHLPAKLRSSTFRNAAPTDLLPGL